MKISFYPYKLQFRYPFRIAHGVRSKTPVVYVEIYEGGITGFGEAALPPYLAENVETVEKFLSKLDLSKFGISDGVEKIMDYVSRVETGNNAAKAAVDIALHDLFGKINKISLKQIFNNQNLPAALCTFTLGISSAEEMQRKISGAIDFNIFKIKLNGENDKQIIETFLSLTDKKFCVDVNQGWNDKYYALEMAHWLFEKGAILMEQPLPKNMTEETAWITDQSPLPIIADESVQVYDDIEKFNGAFSGINIKLMKCGGLLEARKMISAARELNMKVLIGCMSESSCAVTAAAHLSHLADLADLDGPYLISNDPFDGLKVADGKIVLNDAPGIGIRKL